MRFAIVLVLGCVVGCKVSGDEWKRRMEQGLPDKLCEAKQYFRQCFDVDEATCRSTMSQLAHDCLEKVQLPETMSTDEGEKYGREVGRCAGGGYDDKLASKRNSNPKCLDPKNWQ